MNRLIANLPWATTLLAAAFTVALFSHWQRRRQPHVAWWTLGVACFGAGTLIEGLTSLVGWREPLFRLWYIFGALLGAAPLAQGTAYLLLPRRTANQLAAFFAVLAAAAAACAWLSPIDPNVVNPQKLTASILKWQWVRLFSPALNLYALWFLVGGAAWSAWQYRKKQGSQARFFGNSLIAVGALLPGVGGSFARFGNIAVLYVTEFVGLALIATGYAIIRRDPGESIHSSQHTH